VPGGGILGDLGQYAENEPQSGPAKGILGALTQQPEVLSTDRRIGSKYPAGWEPPTFGLAWWQTPPLPNNSHLARWDASTLPIPPALPPVFPSMSPAADSNSLARPIEHLDSAEYWGAYPASSFAMGPQSVQSSYPSSQPRTVSWDVEPSDTSPSIEQPPDNVTTPNVRSVLPPAPTDVDTSSLDEVAAAQEAYRRAAERQRRWVRRNFDEHPHRNRLARKLMPVSLGWPSAYA